MSIRQIAAACALTLGAASAYSAPVIWTDWISAATNGTAAGTLTVGSTAVNVGFTGGFSFVQTSGGTDYWAPTAPYLSAAVDNAPNSTGSRDIVAMASPGPRTVNFGQALDDVFMAIVSLNSNSYIFDQDFVVESFGTGFWGGGTMTRIDNGNGTYTLAVTGEGHGVIHFDGPVSTLSWRVATGENWHGMTVGTYGLANGVPEPASAMLALVALGMAGVATRRTRA